MDRLISEEERIRRAEDILERRKNTNLRISSDNFVKEKSNTRIRNMFIQIFICLLIYCGIYYIKNSQNENIKKFLANIDNVLKYDVDFKKICDEIYKKYQVLNFNPKNNENQGVNNNNQEENNNNQENGEENNADNNQGSGGENNNGEENVEGNNNENNGENSAESNTNEQEDTINGENISENSGEIMGIGGGTEEPIIQNTNVLTQEEQMKVDASYIKKNFNIINPLTQGIVTSRFGSRESTEIVSANHKGIDLGAPTGTVIACAMEGTVTEASSTGDFGLHIKITNADVTVIYAHCSELFVKEGDKINLGQEIAKVGSTGKATGPHLHFEIRRESRAVNPEYLLQF